MDLFISPDIEFEKVSAETDLPEDPNAWPQEVLQELYKQIPYIADFEPHVNMDKVDAERGFGVGHVEVMNQSEMQQGTDTDAMAAAGIRQVRIPVIIKEGRLQPFDLLVTDDSKCVPLTESRLRQALFRPHQFDVTSQTPGDQSMIGQLYPPYRQNYGFGGGGVAMNVGMGKASSALEEYLKKESASDPEGHLGELNPSDSVDAEARLKAMKKKGSVLQAILPTINESDHQQFISTVADDPQLQAAFTKNAAASYDLLKMLIEHEPVTVEKQAQALPYLIKPNVAQIIRTGEGYRVKTASTVFWEPVVEDVHRGEIVQRFGPKIALACDLHGAVTISDTDGVKVAEEAEQEEAGPIKETGLYKVWDVEGKELTGHVFTNLIDVDGQPVPLSLFTNGSQSAVQGDIVGIPIGEATSVPTSDAPCGFGAFVSPECEATVPIEITGSFSGPEEDMVYHQGETFDGRPVVVCMQPNIQVVVGTDDGKMLVPDHWKWMPLEQSGQVELRDSGEDVEKEAAARRLYASVEVRSSGEDSFSINGPPVYKLAHDQREFLDINEAMFLLAGLGVNQQYGTVKLAEAYGGNAPVQIRIGRNIKLASEQVKEAKAAAVERMKNIPVLRRTLFKEAAVITSPVAVDAVLSLGFLNPENITTFISYLPVIEDSQKKMCELLFASRIGLEDIPTSALERAIRSTEEVLEGLKVIAFQSN